MSSRWSYLPREYKVVKVCLSGAVSSFMVLAVDLTDPDVWVVINRFESARDAWRYVSQVVARNYSLAEEAGCDVGRHQRAELTGITA